MRGDLVWSYKLNSASFFNLVSVFPAALIPKHFHEGSHERRGGEGVPPSRPVMTGLSVVPGDFSYLLECSSETASVAPGFVVDAPR